MSDAPGGVGNPDPGFHDILQFGPVAFEMSKSRLRRDGVEVHLTPKAAAVLGYLLQRPGELITKDEFFETVWPDVHVREESLTQAISVIRQALGDSAQGPQFIETVTGEGYRFIGDLSTASNRA
ncbi:MAG: transcriptional regulator, partial [Acidobacteriota bacterium]